MHKKTILVTGATGYVGGRLVNTLLEKKYNVKILVRNKKRLENKRWYSYVEIHEGDMLNYDTLNGLFNNIDIAFYLIHSMSDNNNYQKNDIIAAKNFCKAANNSNLEKIIYLGGLSNTNQKLSEHLKSRQNTGHELRKSNFKIIEFRAGVIVGSGSISFEIIRNLSERLPIMICPQWIYTKTQPIAIINVLEYLVQSIKIDKKENCIIEIGGKDILSYRDMIKQYCNVRKLKRYLIPVPVLSPNLSSYWVHWTTPISANITRPLIQSLKNESIVKNEENLKYFKNIELLSYKEAVRLAINNFNKHMVETSWSDSLSSSHGIDNIVDLKSTEGLIIEKRKILINSSNKKIFRFLMSLGGDNGWLYANYLWVIRGMIDLLFGGVGLRRGRRHPEILEQGDAVDFWRLEKLLTNKILRFKAEMKVPGEAWLQYEIIKLSNKESELIQTAFFAPKGLFGILYWYSLYPIHKIIFSGLSKSIKIKVERT